MVDVSTDEAGEIIGLAFRHFAQIICFYTLKFLLTPVFVEEISENILLECIGDAKLLDN